MDAREALPAVAVIGMAGRFPGAPTVEALWRNLCAGVESVCLVPDEELLAAGVTPELLAHPAYVRSVSALDDIECFDADFFGYTPREAELIDPQQRLFLECAWHALENAGYDPERSGRGVGVYGGTSLSSYLLRLAARPERVAALGAWQAGLANSPDFLTSRVAYKLDLDGPACTVQTAD